MRRVTTKLLSVGAALWVPWLMVVAFNAGRNLAELVFNDPLTTWQLYSEVTWHLTAWWGALLVVAVIVGEIHRWLTPPAAQ